VLTLAGEHFLQAWQSQYPGTMPIAHGLKWHFPKRWVRFHSLPDGQRYARNLAEHNTILMHQNKIIDALLPQNTIIKIVLSKLEDDCHLFQSLNLTPLGAIPDEAAEVPMLAWLTDDVWETGGLDVLLAMIVGDQARAIIMGPECLIAPYDGGIDVIAKDAFTAHALKRQFKDWVSRREDGL
jgi:hypothetical protein